MGYTLSPQSGSAQFDFSQSGTLVYRSGGAVGSGQLVTLQWLDETGKTQPLPAKPGRFNQTRLSPDGKFLALTIDSESGTDIYTYDWQRDAMTRLTFGGGTFSYPAWSSDGRYIAFLSDTGMLWTRADGSSKPQPLTQSKNIQYPLSFSPDGKRLAFVESGGTWTLPIENQGGQMQAGRPELFLQTSSVGGAFLPAFSPDGRWIAYTSIESGKAETFVRAFPDKGGRWQISNSGGLMPIWSQNGHELFYETEDRQIMVVTYQVKGDSFIADKPRLWADKRLAVTGSVLNFDITPDGKRLVVLMPVEGADEQKAQNHVTFLLNFFDELRRRVPTGAK
jgi:Tol biopolymer transport system component